MTPTVEQLAQSRASLLTEASDLETRATELRKQAAQTEGVMLYLQQQAKAAQEFDAAAEDAAKLEAANATLKQVSDEIGKSKLS